MKNLHLSESLFNKKVLKRLEHKCFLMNFAIFFRKDFFDDKSFFFCFLMIFINTRIVSAKFIALYIV